MKSKFQSFLVSPIQHVAVAAGAVGASTPLIDMASHTAATGSANLALGLWLAAGYFWLTDADTWMNWMGA